MQFSRRSFFEAGAAAAVLPLTASARNPRLPMTVVVDSRLAESVRFGSRCRIAGISSAQFSGDVTPALRSLLPAPHAGRPDILVGLTHASTLFCLEQLAWQYDMRVVQHSMHDALALSHTMLRAGWTADATDIAAAGHAWPEALAATLIAARPDRMRDVERRADARRPGPSAIATPASFDALDSTLHAWVIAPVLRDGWVI